MSRAAFSSSRRGSSTAMVSSEHAHMALMFPNASRSYDATRHAVRFWGYDSAMEWSFFVTAEALERIRPSLVQDEAGMLGAFDSSRDRICAAAARLYSRGRKGSYELGAGDV
jgi:hypothetical protein